ncbi:MAG TPA: hypothetical protein VIX89_20125 [Bryobacteraceae bacterium]
MESALLGLVLDSSAVIGADRNEQSIPEFIEAILRAHGPVNLSLSPVTSPNLCMESIERRRPGQLNAAAITSKSW